MKRFQFGGGVIESPLGKKKGLKYNIYFLIIILLLESNVIIVHPVSESLMEGDGSNKIF